MAKKSTTKKTASKAAPKTAKKATKKVARKVAAKKTAKKATKRKVVKKAPKKVLAVEQELNLESKPAPTHEQLQQAAYLNYLDRINTGKPGSPELDWEMAVQELT